MSRSNSSKPRKRQGKRPTNLSLDVDALERGKRYSRLHGTSLSKLVNDYLRSLPGDSELKPLSPVVQRLSGIAAGGKVGREDYRRYLRRKYGIE